MEGYWSLFVTDTDKKHEKKIDKLVDKVFSWSLGDVLNRNLYNGKVVKIPKTFSSVYEYTNSFIHPLYAETHADLLSKIRGVNYRSPTAEIKRVQESEGFLLPKLLLYTIFIESGEGFYVPEAGDLIALTNVKPKSVDDLRRPYYLIALVQDMEIESSLCRLSVLSSELIFYQPEVLSDDDDDREDLKYFVVYLTNLTTNIRISRVLHSEIQSDGLEMLKNVLGEDFSVNERCAKCPGDTTSEETLSKTREDLKTFQLDSSQEAAVLSCIAARDCRHHHRTIKLIWGPPGTGKTKTVGSLLFMLLRMKCRTLTCAPTNVAVLGVTKRVMSLVKDRSLDHDTYGLGDLVLFGNGERMKIDDREDLLDIFLSVRVDILGDCFARFSGWTGSSQWMFCFLKDPEAQYQLYKDELAKGDEDKDEKEDEYSFDFSDEKKEESYESQVKGEMEDRNWKTLFGSTSKGGKKLRNGKPTSSKVANDHRGKKISHKKDGESDVLSFEQFVIKGFDRLGNQLIFCVENLYTHMPTSCISVEQAKRMKELVCSLQRFGQLLKQIVSANIGLREALNGSDDDATAGGNISDLRACRILVLKLIKYLRIRLCLPDLRGDVAIRRFCLENACLIFCTVSNSINLHIEGKKPIEFLVIDEAAQLKECESLIPLQLEGLRHAILVGDERQLPAMVQSKISEEAEFGRSLFERLASLGHKKHLLNVQYRMHPYISQFPNNEFYDKQIMDGVNVKSSCYEKRFLQGSMYGPYSFINVSSAKEEFDRGQSRKNLMEVAIAAEIIARLFKESVARRQPVSVGCISPYKAQVTALQEKLGNKYMGSENDFSVNVRSVDGFQGSEEDVIIISTVRCNGNGSIGFLSNHQRTNVALTRARYCLFILGNESTLINSGSIWKNLIVDAKDRGCFFNASEDKNLSQAALGAMIDLRQIDSIFNMDSILFTEAKWQVKFSDMFLDTITRLTFNPRICKEVAFILVKLSSGWRPSETDGDSVTEIATCPLLVKYKITQDLQLIWAVDIVTQNSRYVQVLKIWDILPATKIEELAKTLKEKVYGNYTETMISRCKEKHVDGNLVLPITWSVIETDPTWSLALQLAALNFGEQRASSSSSRTSSVRGYGNTNSMKYGDSKSHGRGRRW